MASRDSAFAIAVASLTFAVAPAFAAETNLEHAQQVLDKASTSLSQAISTVEGQVGGKAISARLMRSQGEDFYDVRVLKDDKLTDVRVGIADGKILDQKAVENHHAGKQMPPKMEHQSDSKS